MKNYFILFHALFLIFLIQSCATSPTGRNQLSLISDNEMKQLGEKSFEEIKNTTPIDTDIRRNDLVKCVANSILINSNLLQPDQPWEIVVFKSDEINAFALPGGKIGVFTGIFKIAKSTSQLAAVIGHEIGHVIAKHGNERVSQSIGASIGFSILDLITGKSDPNTKKIIMAGMGLGVQYGILLPFSRNQEIESDVIGLNLMSHAGFDPKEAPEIWKNMSSIKSNKSIPEFLSTHPSDEKRIRILNEKLPEYIPIFERSIKAEMKQNCKFI